MIFQTERDQLRTHTCRCVHEKDSQPMDTAGLSLYRLVEVAFYM
ncbi:hypothetical protein NPIL_476581, partial [Nephila pilipes]